MGLIDCVRAWGVALWALGVCFGRLVGVVLGLCRGGLGVARGGF